jgi:hypothetical protein
MKIYFERQPRRERKAARWWLFRIREADEGTELTLFCVRVCVRKTLQNLLKLGPVSKI